MKWLVYSQIGKHAEEQSLLITGWKTVQKSSRISFEGKKPKSFLIALSASTIKIVITAI